MAKVIVALDFPDRNRALDLVDRLGPDARYFKVGLELFTHEGPEIVKALRMRGRRVFLDLKLHDIPNTVGRAVRAAASLEVDLLTLHASGGERMLAAARQAVEGSTTRLLAVTILTSHSGDELARSWGRSEIHVQNEVCRLAAMATDQGIHGVVASAAEAGVLRSMFGPGPLIVTPGIRLADESPHDQHRVATPGEAARAGADFLVVGRTVSQADDPVRALARIRSEIARETP